MRGATECARRLKRVIRSIRSESGRADPLPADDPITHLILGVFSRDAPESRAREALERMRRLVVDYNELRVTAPREIAEQVGDYPDAYTKAEDMSRALNRIFAIEHTVSLAPLAGRSRKEVRDYLARIDGLEPYTRARVMLFGLQQHAVPLDEAMWAHARRLGLVDARCSLEEAQSFLERQIDPAFAVEFFLGFRRRAWAEVGAAVRRGETEKIRSIPPKRASKNMLRPIDLSELGTEGELAPVETPPRKPGGKGAARPARDGRSAPQAVSGARSRTRAKTTARKKPRASATRRARSA